MIEENTIFAKINGEKEKSSTPDLPLAILVQETCIDIALTAGNLIATGRIEAPIDSRVLVSVIQELAVDFEKSQESTDIFHRDYLTDVEQYATNELVRRYSAIKRTENKMAAAM
jgi:hypothetical protein